MFDAISFVFKDKKKFEKTPKVWNFIFAVFVVEKRNEIFHCLTWKQTKLITKATILIVNYLLWQQRVSPSGGDWGIPPTNQKMGSPPHVPPLFCLKNVDFVLLCSFLQFCPKCPPLIELKWENLQHWGFLLYSIRKILAKKMNFLGTETKKWHTCEEGGTHLRISFWNLLMNLKNKLLKKLLKWANKNKIIVIFTRLIDIIIKTLMIWSTVF